MDGPFIMTDKLSRSHTDQSLMKHSIKQQGNKIIHQNIVQ